VYLDIIEAINLECYWRVVNGQSGESFLFRLALAWQLQDARSHSWETDLCSCNNQVDSSINRDLCGIAIDRQHTQNLYTDLPIKRKEKFWKTHTNENEEYCTRALVGTTNKE